MNFYAKANGKLLLSGEYFVTEGAVALGLPTRLGQSLEAKIAKKGPAELLWTSLLSDGETWFQGRFDLANFEILEHSEHQDAAQVAQNLQSLLQAARNLNPEFLTKGKEVKVETKLDFPRNWGLGSSSTLVSLLAQWAEVDAFQLLDATFGGSGYDLVAAKSNKPFLFQKFNGKNRWETARFQPEFAENLYFVHLNKKQDSRLALVHYTVTPPEERHMPLGRISQITHNLNAYAPSLDAFDALLEEHETLVQSVVRQPKAKDHFFADFWGQIKSLGAWGGDFVLATSNRPAEETKAYFQNKGFDTVLSYAELIQQED